MGAGLIERCVREESVEANDSKAKETVSRGTEQAHEDPVPDEPST